MTIERDRKLYEKINRHFNVSELKGLCFFLDIEYDNIRGETKDETVQELIKYCERHEQTRELVNMCARLRPTVAWPGASIRIGSMAILPSLIPISTQKYLLALIVVAIIFLIAGISVERLFLANATRTPMRTDILVPANVKELIGFETPTLSEVVTDWRLSTCPNLDVAQCGWLNASDRLSLAETGFTGEHSLQVEAKLLNTEQIYSLEYCFDPTLLDAIDANVHVPRRNNDEQSSAVKAIHLLARPQDDDNLTKQWPTSILEVDSSTQPGWYRVSLDLSQVADESREPYNSLLVDCVHIDFILPSAPQNEETIFLVDNVTLYRDASSHDLTTNIAPQKLTDERIKMTTQSGEGPIFSFEDGQIDNAIWSASDGQGEQPLIPSRDHAYDGIYSMAFDAQLMEKEGNSGGNTFCITVNGNNQSRDLTLQNRIVISRLYIPEDVPENFGVQYHLSGQTYWPSWDASYASIKSGQWNTLVWYTADSPDEWNEESVLNLCLYLRDRGIEDKNEYGARFYLDSIELIPYEFVHLGDPRTLSPINFYDFDTEKLPERLIPGAGIGKVTPTVRLESGDVEIYALQLDLDLPQTQSVDPTNSMANLLLDTSNRPVEAVLAMVGVPEEPGGTLLITFAGALSNGEVISQTFQVTDGSWTPIFWPTRSNDLDAMGGTPNMEELSIFISSPEPYQGPILFDYLATYRFLPTEQ